MMKIFLFTVAVTLLNCSSSENQWFPKYHFAPKKGWMNDPNGLSYFNGFYHLFYQHNPFDTKSGLMHWGHARSKDMLNWEHLPIALAPSLPEDLGGIFSGSAAVFNNTLVIMYTGVSEDSNHQVQCLATSSDGDTLVKEGMVLQKDGDDKDFRDPKLWRQNDSWFVIIGSTNDNKGEVLLYKSPDLHNWEYQGVLLASDDKLGYMWECPDFFTLDNKQILVVNPQGVASNGYDYQNLYQTGYFVGNWIPGEQYEVEKYFRELDHGQDFYAAQTFLAPDDRRILIGWMDMWESEFPESTDGWAGMFTLPRELTLLPTGDVQMRPIKEIFDLRKTESVHELRDLIIKDPYFLIHDSVLSKEIIMDFDISECDTEKFGISIAAANVTDLGIQIYINCTAQRLFLDKFYPKYNILASSRSVAIDMSDTVSLDIFIDSSSIEIFVNDGQAVLSSRMYPNHDERALGIFGSTDKIVVERFISWDL